MLIMMLITAVAFLLMYLVLIYNQLVRLQNFTSEGWSGIDVQLKQRADLIPNLVETVKGYMGHEKGVLENVTKLRSQAMSADSVEERANSENMLTSALRQLFAVSENYPDLKASQNFIELQNTLTNIENQIQLSRRYYNGTVRELNIKIQSFPSNLIAKAFSFEPAEFFGIEDAADKEVPTVKLS